MAQKTRIEKGEDFDPDKFDKKLLEKCVIFDWKDQPEEVVTGISALLSAYGFELVQKSHDWLEVRLKNLKTDRISRQYLIIDTRYPEDVVEQLLPLLEKANVQLFSHETHSDCAAYSMHETPKVQKTTQIKKKL